MKTTGVVSLVVVLSLAVAVLCSGCMSPTTVSPSPTAAVNNTTIVVKNATAKGADVTISKGQNFTLQLQSNPSTGYRWEPIYDNSSLTLINRTFISNASTRSVPIVGAGGTDVFTFQAMKQGTTIVIFNNISPANQTINSLNYTVAITS